MIFHVARRWGHLYLSPPSRGSCLNSSNKTFKFSSLALLARFNSFKLIRHRQLNFLVFIFARALGGYIVPTFTGD